MGNSATKEARPSSSLARSASPAARDQHNASTTAASGSLQVPNERTVYAGPRGGRGSQHSLSIFGIGGGSERDAPPMEARRETRAEREARKLEKERVLRAKERERSMREEGVDGGYLVTLGTYIGPEDYNKTIVRQLMIERRLAPFWKGLNDHEDSWTENQLVAAVQGLPIPPADEIPAEEPAGEQNTKSSDQSLNHLTVPMTIRSPSQASDASTHLSPGHTGFSAPSTSPLSNAQSSSSPFFRGRAKTLAALTTSSKNSSQSEMTPQEVHLPKEPYVNGQRVEAFLYKDASECPICFLYYPPYLNKTRCCDQPICSECFVQIKRPDPHPPEHHGSNDQNTPAEPQDDCMLVSEPASCPFCVQPEFGVSYEAPPFRRGLVYQGQAGRIGNLASAMSSTTSINSQGQPTGRRRQISLSASAPEVITTDRVRPDWAKKLSDARAHALRRSAAATALHNAAYVIGTSPTDSRGGFSLGRRRRNFLSTGDSPNSSGQGTPSRPENANAVASLLAGSERRGSNGGGRERNEGQADLVSGRQSSRRSRMDDLEDLMMMEAIRLSLATEEERRKKEEKEQAKTAKKEEKKKAKEAKKAQKNGKKHGFFPFDMPGGDESSAAQPQSQPSLPGPSGAANANDAKGKGIDRSAGAGFNPTSEPTLTLNTSGQQPSSTRGNPQRHLEESRARIQTQSPMPPPSISADNNLDHRAVLRQISGTSSSASSLADSEPDARNPADADRESGADSSIEASPNTSGLELSHATASASASASDDALGGAAGSQETPGGGAGTEPMFNFRSLAAVIGNEEKGAGAGSEHIEHFVEGPQPRDERAVGLRPEEAEAEAMGGKRSRGDSGESSSSGGKMVPGVVVSGEGDGEGVSGEGCEVTGQRVLR